MFDFHNQITSMSELFTRVVLEKTDVVSSVLTGPTVRLGISTVSLLTNVIILTLISWNCRTRLISPLSKLSLITSYVLGALYNICI